MSKITLAAIAERKRAAYVAWLRAEVNALRDMNDIDMFREADRLEREADRIEDYDATGLTFLQQAAA